MASVSDDRHLVLEFPTDRIDGTLDWNGSVDRSRRRAVLATVPSLFRSAPN
jgi:hypothetical protein